MVATKICGLSTPETVSAAVSGGAEHVGFVLFPPSPRNVSLPQLRMLSGATPGHVAKVGVFVDPDDKLIEAAIAAGRLTILQLHRTSPSRAAELRRRTGLNTWVAVAVNTRGDLDLAQGYHGAADRILYDAKTLDASALPGGMGVRFDWSLLEGFRHSLPWALSGGLDADNIIEAVTRTGAKIVDVSSGVESAPGIKDIGKIAAFLKGAASI